MQNRFTLSAVAISLFWLSSSSFAAAMDRSGQSTLAFLQPEHYAELSYNHINPSVSGQYRDGSAIADMGSRYDFFTAALKLQANPQLSVGLLWDHPFGGAAEYHGDNPLVEQGSAGFKANTKVDVKSNNLSLLLGYQPHQRINVFAGPVYQMVEGDVQFAGPGFKYMSGYSNQIERSDGWGWLAGAAYSVPEIALKAAVTYRSKIDHKADTAEQFKFATLKNSATDPVDQYVLNLLDQSVGENYDSNFTITTPQSLNLDFQTGIAQDTVAFANLRWVNWKDFTLRPAGFNRASTLIGQLKTNGQYQGGFDLTDYAKDQWSGNIGVGRKFNATWSGNISLGYDSGAGNPISTLGPTEGYWSLGAGVRYQFNPQYELSVGGKYLWLGDASVQRGDYAIPGNSAAAYVGEFENNHAWAWGAKFGYRF